MSVWWVWGVNMWHREQGLKLQFEGPYRFNRLIPIQNWYYPLDYKVIPWRSDQKFQNIFFGLLSPSIESKRALYFHIPFCDTICNFCPFVRSSHQENELIDTYVSALRSEILLKTKHPEITKSPVGSIFFGGGTPSLLSSKQIRTLGKAIHDNFDLSQLDEFSFEMEVKSVTEDKLNALLDIGVTHVRFGLQTFDSRYRELFGLTASLDDIYKAIELMRQKFRFVSFDMMYGMSGQTLDGFMNDVDYALDMGTNLIDFYPINNAVTQPKLHRAFKKHKLAPTPASLRWEMNRYLRDRMKDGGFLPHNGHGYVRVDKDEIKKNPVVTSSYSFRYHEYVYGYGNMEVLGFGINAISTTRAISIQNDSNKKRYIQMLLRDELPCAEVGICSKNAAASKPLILRLPYHGEVDVKRIDLMAVNCQTLERLSELMDAGLIEDSAGSLKLTQEGWLWYVNIMYYLLPDGEQAALDKIVEDAIKDEKRSIPYTEVMLDTIV